jgi:simple sugar transport system ATP-binding protein
MVHQHFTLVPAMTVAENVALGGKGRFVPAEWAARVREIGGHTGLALDPLARVSELSVGAQQRCEIVKALARDVRILILDEPTAVLAPAEAQDLLRWVRAFANEGHSVVLITHKLRDALAVADDVTVLRRGKTVMSQPVSGTTEAQLVAAMLGEERDIVRGTEAAMIPNSAAFRSPAQPPVLQARNASVRDARGIWRVHGANLDVRKGELVGIAAIEGAGQHELLRLLAGRLKPTSGTVTIPDTVGFVPEDRHLDALMLDASLVENIALRNAGARNGRMPWKAFGEATRAIIASYHVRARGEHIHARTLSGGNQQKLIVGRELSNAPDALVVENPTRGLDFRAASAVHDALRRARADGAAVVVYSSDLDEVLSLADRVLVVHDGHVLEVAGDRDSIGQAMLGIGTTGAP